jgi:tripartite-type tricarboxylate transporter receptor subunit TctC
VIGLARMISRRTLLLTAAAAPLASHAALAAYPDKPVRLICPFAAGGNADFVARMCAEGMRQALGKPFIVENRAGAGGSLGAEQVAKAAPDGYTLLTGSNGPLTVNPFVQAKLPYDPLKDFVAIGLANLAPHCLAVSEKVLAKTLQELIALSKTSPVNIGTSGAGSATHMTLARFNAATGAKLEHVPYRGGGALVPELLAGTITGAMTELSTVLPHIGQGKIRVLAVASAKRAPRAADVPTMVEQGVKDFTAASYVGIVAPAGVPADLVKALEGALMKALNNKDTEEKFLATGAELVPDELMTSKGFGDYIKREYEQTREAAKLAGLTPT